jgi:hypothetical protein
MPPAARAPLQSLPVLAARVPTTRLRSQSQSLQRELPNCCRSLWGGGPGLALPAAGRERHQRSTARGTGATQGGSE